MPRSRKVRLCACVGPLPTPLRVAACTAPHFLSRPSGRCFLLSLSRLVTLCSRQMASLWLVCVSLSVLAAFRVRPNCLRLDVSLHSNLSHLSSTCPRLQLSLCLSPNSAVWFPQHLCHSTPSHFLSARNLVRAHDLTKYMFVPPLFVIDVGAQLSRGVGVYVWTWRRHSGRRQIRGRA